MDTPYNDGDGEMWYDALELPGSDPLIEDIWFVDAIYLQIQSLEHQTLVIGMIAITMIAFLGAKCLSKNEEPVEEPVEEPIVEEVRFRGLFGQVIDKVCHIFRY